MRQVARIRSIWLAMILVVAGVIYLMPRVASYVGAAETEQNPACTTCEGRVVSS